MCSRNCVIKRQTFIRNEEGNEDDEKVKLLFDEYQLIGRNAENNEKEMLKKKKNMIYQGMNANHKNI